MKLPPRGKLYLSLSIGIFLLHIGVATFARPSFFLTILGDAFPCALLIVCFFCFAENFQIGSGVSPIFWKLSATGLLIMLLSDAYWFYYDSLRRSGAPSPIPGDVLFLLAHVFLLFALALRPHAIAAPRDFRIRRLDFALLTLWWFALYAYFALPWQILVSDYSHYNPAYYFLALVQHLVLIVSLVTLSIMSKQNWRVFYALLALALIFIAAGNLLQNIFINLGYYYSGGFCDTPSLFALVWFTIAGCYGYALEPSEESRPDRELKQSIWTARTAMLAILSLPLVALLGFYASKAPTPVAVFRLKVVFGALFFLGALVFWKLNLLARELIHLVNLTKASIENLKAVQNRITQSQKYAALGRLAAGATHEISNPLTAILGYSELLADIPSLSTQDKENAQAIQQQVHRAQAAVISLRDSLRTPSPPHPITAKTTSDT